MRADRAPSTLLYINVNATEDGQFLAEVPVTEITMDPGATETFYILRTENDSIDEPNGSVTGSLDTGTTYTINDSASSDVVHVLDDDLPPPPAPGGLEVTFADSDSVSLVWDTLAGASKYRVRHSLSGQNRWTYHGESSSRSLTVSSLTNDRLYDFQVQARGNNTTYDNVLGAWSGTITGSTPKVAISNLGGTLTVGQSDNFNVVATSLNRHLNYALSVVADQETGVGTRAEEEQRAALARADCSVRIVRTDIDEDIQAYTWNLELTGCSVGRSGLSTFLFDRTGATSVNDYREVDRDVNTVRIGPPPNNPPTITGPDDTDIDYEDDDTGNVADFSAYDPDGDSIRWSLSGIDANRLSISRNTGVLTFDEPPDFEAPADSGRNNEYEVTVVATDDGSPNLSDSVDVEVTVTNVNETPTVRLRISNRTLDIGDTSRIGLASRFGDPDGDTLRYSARSSNTAVATERLSGRTLIITAIADGTTTIIVTASDRSAGHSDLLRVSQSFDVTVLPPDPPGQVPRPSVTEGYQQLEVVWSEPGNEGGAPITGYNIRRTAGSASRVFSDPASPYILTGLQNGTTYTVEVRACSTAGCGEWSPPVEGTPFNTVPAVGGTVSANIAENTTREVGRFTAEDSDPQGGGVDWLVTGYGTAHLSKTIVNSYTMALNVETAFDYENPQDRDRDNRYPIQVFATDRGAPKATSQAWDFTLVVTGVNEPPVLTNLGADPDDLLSIQYDENGTADVRMFMAIDPEGDDIEWTVGGLDGRHFDPDTPTLHFRNSPNFEMPLDVGQDNHYDVNVTVSDDATPSESTSLNVRVEVINVNEMPSFSGTINDQVYTDDRPIMKLMLPFAESDELPLEYRLDGVDNDEVPAGLNVHLTTAENFIDGRPAGASDTHELVYIARDPQGDEARIPFTIEVNRIPHFRDLNYTPPILYLNHDVQVQLPRAKGGDGPLRYSLRDYPDGMSFDEGHAHPLGATGNGKDIHHDLHRQGHRLRREKHANRYHGGSKAGAGNWLQSNAAPWTQCPNCVGAQCERKRQHGQHGLRPVLPERDWHRPPPRKAEPVCAGMGYRPGRTTTQLCHARSRPTR